MVDVVSPFRMESLSIAEKNNVLHESYQFLVKKYIPKEHRSKKKSREEKAKAEAEAAQAEVEAVPEVVDSAIDFSHLNN